jgi:hypothetical protein
MKAELRRLEVEAKNLGGAIAQYGTHRSPTLIAQLSHVENRIGAIKSQLQEVEPALPEFSIGRIREFVLD